MQWTLNGVACSIKSISFIIMVMNNFTLPSVLQVFPGRLDSLAVATIKALTTVMLKSPAAKVTRADLFYTGSAKSRS